jgi:guanylate kinase
MAYNVIALIGEAGSGKDTLMRKLVEANPQLNEVVSYTTRPPREGEVNGVNYHFITGEEFGELVVAGKMFEASCFNDWFYGTGVDSLKEDKLNIGVFNPEGIESLMQHSNVNLTVIRVWASDKNRLIRQLNREEFPDVDEIIRRYKADREDFDALNFPHYIVDNNTLEGMQESLRLLNLVVKEYLG